MKVIDFRPDIREKLDKALNSTGVFSHSVDDVLQDILDGHSTCWTSEDSVLIGQVCREPQTTSLHIWLAAGDLQECLDLSEEMAVWAKQEFGCTHVTFTGRLGWQKVLKERGWGANMITMSKEL